MSRFTYRPPAFTSWLNKLKRVGRPVLPTISLPVADFGIFGLTPTVAPGVVRFLSISSFHGPPTYFLLPRGGAVDTYLWDFGDGTPGDTGQAPFHTYENPGSYDVSLTVCNSAGCDTLVKQNFIQLSLTGSVSISLLNDDDLLSASIRHGEGPAATFAAKRNISAGLRSVPAVFIRDLRDDPNTSVRMRSLDA
jgi:hypothetical protein